MHNGVNGVNGANGMYHLNGSSGANGTSIPSHPAFDSIPDTIAAFGAQQPLILPSPLPLTHRPTQRATNS